MGGGHHEPELAREREFYPKYDRIGTGFYLGEFLKELGEMFNYGWLDSVRAKEVANQNTYRQIDKGLGIPGEKRDVRVLRYSLDDVMNTRGKIQQAWKRSYCLHHMFEWKRCVRVHSRRPHMCEHEEHAFGGCMIKEQYLRTMEFERIRRINDAGLLPDFDAETHNARRFVATEANNPQAPKNF